MKKHNLKLFNTGQVTLPKTWREKFDTKLFIAKETPEGLLIQPIFGGDDGTVFYEDESGFGIYSEKGIKPKDLIRKIKEIHGLS